MDGTFSISQLLRKIRKNDIHEPITRVICVENTHNILGGKVIPLEWLEEVIYFELKITLRIRLMIVRSICSKLNYFTYILLNYYHLWYIIKTSQILKISFKIAKYIKCSHKENASFLIYLDLIQITIR